MPEAGEKQSEPKSSGLESATEGWTGFVPAPWRKRNAGRWERNLPPAGAKLVIRHPFPVAHRQRPRSFRGYPVKGTRATKAAFAPRIFPRQTSHRTNQEQQSYPCWPHAADSLFRTPVCAHLYRTILYSCAQSGTRLAPGMSRQVLLSELIRHAPFRCGRNVFDEFAQRSIGCLVRRGNPGVLPGSHLLIGDVHDDLP
ncbi:MAG: hypothetical protein BWY06_00666 [Candidatus Latescibacteria bacterium ADurb.Bin168]|nr:MAG: hypothetical protein BWY06_00666 [Candidatus Latescibacteria bacterium ADurb.Bin168]